LRGDELRVLKAWLTERARMKPVGKTLFVSERRQPMSRKTAWVIIRDYSTDAGLAVTSHPHL
jgi:type 1 fimbriae regulatory protein FimB